LVGPGWGVGVGPLAPVGVGVKVGKIVGCPQEGVWVPEMKYSVYMPPFDPPAYPGQIVSLTINAGCLNCSMGLPIK
jgi:hypothetical protein